MNEKKRLGALWSSARMGVVCGRARNACHTAAIGAAPGAELRRRGWRGCSAGSGERLAAVSGWPIGGGE